MRCWPINRLEFWTFFLIIMTVSYTFYRSWKEAVEKPRERKIQLSKKERKGKSNNPFPREKKHSSEKLKLMGTYQCHDTQSVHFPSWTMWNPPWGGAATARRGRTSKWATCIGRRNGAHGPESAMGIQISTTHSAFNLLCTLLCVFLFFLYKSRRKSFKGTWHSSQHHIDRMADSGIRKKQQNSHTEKSSNPTWKKSGKHYCYYHHAGAYIKWVKRNPFYKWDWRQRTRKEYLGISKLVTSVNSPCQGTEWANTIFWVTTQKEFLVSQKLIFIKTLTTDRPYLISLLIASNCSWSIMAKVWASAWPLGDSRSTELNIVSLSSSTSDTSTSLSNACATFANTLACWARSQSCSFRVWT